SAQPRYQRRVLWIDFDEVDHRADAPRAPSRGVQLDHRRKAILRLERTSHRCIVRPHACAKDCPIVTLSERKQIVEINRHMGAVKVANAYMHDPRSQSSTIVLR